MIKLLIVCSFNISRDSGEMNYTIHVIFIIFQLGKATLNAL